MIRLAFILLITIQVAVSSPLEAARHHGGGGSSQTISAIELSNAATTTGLSSGAAVGTLSVLLSPAAPSFAYTGTNLHLSTTGGDSGGVCSGTNGAANGSFQIGSGDTLETNGAITAGSKLICVAAGESGVSSSGQAFTISVGNLIDAASFCATNGGGTGATGSPWHDSCIVAAVNAASAGDTVFLAAGNWALSTASAASFTGVISGTTLTVSSVTGTIKVGQALTDPSGNIFAGTQITGGSGTTWTISPSQSVASESMLSGYGVIIPKTINLVGAGSGNTFDALGHPNNGSPTVLTAPTSQTGQTVTRVYTTGTSQTAVQCSFPGGYIQLIGTSQTVSHIFFDGSATTNGGDFCGTIAFFQATNGIANDVRVLNFNNPNVAYGAETQFAIEQTNGNTVLNSVVAQPILLGAPTLCSPSSLQATVGNGLTVQNTYFYQSNFNPIAFDNVTFTGNVIFDSTDSFCTTGETPGTGPAGGALGPAASAPANGTGAGNFHYTFSNNYLSMGGQLYGMGVGLNDPTTNGGVSDVNITGSWFSGMQVAIDSCVWHYYDPSGGWSGRNPSFPDYYACAPTDPNGGGMQVNATDQPWVNCSQGTSDPPNAFSFAPGYGLNSSNNSLIATSSAQIIAVGAGLIPCHQIGGGIVQLTGTVVNFRSHNNYFSSPNNIYHTDATTLNPTVNNNFCAQSSPNFSGCLTSGFVTLPTGSFTLGPLSQTTVAFTASGFTAQYGAVEWLASTSSTTPTSGDARWSFTPPASLASVTHGNTVYMWVMDSASHIGAPVSAFVP